MILSDHDSHRLLLRRPWTFAWPPSRAALPILANVRISLIVVRTQVRQAQVPT